MSQTQSERLHRNFTETGVMNNFRWQAWVTVHVQVQAQQQKHTWFDDQMPHKHSTYQPLGFVAGSISHIYPCEMCTASIPSSWRILVSPGISYQAQWNILCLGQDRNETNTRPVKVWRNTDWAKVESQVPLLDMWPSLHCSIHTTNYKGINRLGQQSHVRLWSMRITATLENMHECVYTLFIHICRSKIALQSKMSLP